MIPSSSYIWFFSFYNPCKHFRERTCSEYFVCLPVFLPSCLPAFLPCCLFAFLPVLRLYIPACLPACFPTFIPAYSACLPACSSSTCLPTCLPNAWRRGGLGDIFIHQKMLQSIVVLPTVQYSTIIHVASISIPSNATRPQLCYHREPSPPGFLTTDQMAK